MRNIAVFTATRAEYGLLRPLLLALRASADCQVQLVVSGAHLSAEHGHTLDAIFEDGFTPAACVPLYEETPHPLHRTLGRAVAAYGDALTRLAPHIVVIDGDRYEALCMVLAATSLRVPVAHISGGETSQGSQDELFRHAITKMAQLHFPSCGAHRQRLLQLGENPEHVWDVGSLGLECVHSLPLLSEAEIRAELDIGEAPYMLCTLHPDSLRPGNASDNALNDLKIVCAALETRPDYRLVFTGANADEGGRVMNDFLRDYVRVRPQHRFYLSLGQIRYFSAVSHAACVLGNSSSGIIEVPSLGVPVVNIGPRQQGRVCATSVLHCPLEAEAIASCLVTALSPPQRILARTTENIYTHHDTSQKIADILLSFPLADIVYKKFYDVP